MPEHTQRFATKLAWTNELNDYDLVLRDPEGYQAASSAGGVPQTSEETGVSEPAPGEWTFEVDRFATLTDALTMAVTGGAARRTPGRGCLRAARTPSCPALSRDWQRR